MTISELTYYRLLNQHIAHSPCKTPVDVVSSMGAMQAQDYLASLWAIALRLPGAIEADIEQAVSERKIIRTWAMRGTLHFIAAEDARWMLKLLTPGIIEKSAGIYRKSGADKDTVDRSKDLIINALQGGKRFTRELIYKELNEANISTHGNRGLHITGQLAMNGVICPGPREGKQHTFVLLDEWLPKFKDLEKDEALAEIALRYFKSHGPATLNDFVWWSGLKVSDAKTALEIIKSGLKHEVVEGQTYWFHYPLPYLKDISKDTCLLPAFDEFLISYQDRSAALDPAHFRKVFTKNGIFNPVIVRGGRVIGTWKRNFINEEVVINLTSFAELKKSYRHDILSAAKQYSKLEGKFLREESLIPG